MKTTLALALLAGLLASQPFQAAAQESLNSAQLPSNVVSGGNAYTSYAVSNSAMAANSMHDTYVSGSVGAVTVLNGPQIQASALGNYANVNVTGGNYMGGSNNMSFNISQNNSGSNTATVSGVNTSMNIGTINAGGGKLNQRMTSNVTSTNSPATASIR